MKRCPYCNASINDDDKFCMFCGEKIEDTPIKEKPQIKCKQCGSIIEEGFDFCMNCGAKREEAIETDNETNTGSYIFGKTYDENSRSYLFKDNIFKTIPEYFKNAFNFTGRACRAEYWFPYLIIEVIFLPIVTTIIETALPQFEYTIYLTTLGLDYSFNLISVIITLILFIPQLSCEFRRIRDTGRKASTFLINFIPVIGVFIMVFILASETDSYKN